jgi:hypothetical protein
LFDGVTETTEGCEMADKASFREIVIRIRTLSGVLVYVGVDSLAVDDVGRNAFLIHAYGRDDAKRVRLDLLPTVADDADDDLLPSSNRLCPMSCCDPAYRDK